jgi:curved DNA-binding protein CbpA
LVLLGATACVARDADPYKMLDVSRGAGETDVKKAYRKLSLRFHPDKQMGKSADEVERAQEKFMKIQKAYETLSDAEKKRNYDATGFADPRDAYKEQPPGPGGRSQQRRGGSGPGGRGGWDSQGGFPGGRFGGFGFHQPDPITSDTLDLTPGNFAKYVLHGNRPWLVQVYHDGSELSQRAAPIWEQANRAMDGIAKLGRINIALYPTLAAQVAPRHLFSTEPVHTRDLPVVVGYPRECKSYFCSRRYRGLMKESALSAFVMDRLLRLEDVLVQTRDTLPAFIATDPEKVKFIVFSPRSSPTSPLLRRAATEYHKDVTFARIHYKQSDASHWTRKFGVHTPPAVMVLKEGGRKVIEHEVSGKDRLKALLIEHRLHILPQIRISNLKATGCKPGGLVQVCAVVVGVAGAAFDDVKSVLRKAKLALDPSVAVPKSLSTLASALESKEISFVWIDAKDQKGYCQALLSTDEAAHKSCGQASMEPRVVAMRFRDGPDKIEHGMFSGAMHEDAILSWLTGVFTDGQDSSSVLIPADRGAANFPELKVEVHGVVEKLQRIKAEVASTAYDWGEELVYMCIESGPLVPAFILLLILFIPTFFQGASKPKPSVKRESDSKMDGDGVIDFDEKTLACLKDSRREMAVMMFVQGSKTDQEVFKLLRSSFWREQSLKFGVVDLTKLPAWSEFADNIEGGGVSTIVIWHPSRAKYQRIGNGDTPHPALCSQVGKILDGVSPWEEGAWP